MKTITLTSKGQITIPAEARRLLGLKASEKLDVIVDAEARSITLSRPITVRELQAKAQQYIKPGVKPVENVDEYYQQYRMETIR